MAAEYNDTFYDHLNGLIDKNYERGYIKCRQCGQVDGAPRWTKKGNKSKKLKGIVRLCPIDITHRASDYANVGYYCTMCRKEPRTAKVRPSELPQLFPS